MPLETIDAVLAQIDELVRGSRDTGGITFRLRLEELVKRGGRATEKAVCHYITGSSVAVSMRLDLIRIAGYIRSDTFLLPLKKVIELGEDDLLREEAIISVSKFNDRRAIDILSQALGMNFSSQLQQTIHRAIDRIRSENPLLAMLPRFLLGSKNRELFQVTLKVFKKILGPADAKAFLAYLHHGDQLVAEGAFEILCHRGDESVFFFIAEFFREHGRLLARGGERRVSAARLETLIAALHEFLRRHPRFFSMLRSDLVHLHSLAGEARWQRSLAPLLKEMDAVEPLRPREAGAT